MSEPDPTDTPAAPPTSPPRHSHHGVIVFALGATLSLGLALSYGAMRYSAAHSEVIASAIQRRNLVPSVRVATVRATSEDLLLSLPATTTAFASISVFARATGYIGKRMVDIGDHVRAGDLLALITAPELDHQIAQAEATLAQTQATLSQNQANAELARVTWQRNGTLVAQGWVTQQQGDIDRLNLQAQEAAVRVAQANIVAQKAQLEVLRQQKIYQSVVAPFDGVITQRNIDTGSLVQADDTGGTMMFAMMQSDVMRIQVFVPQDQANGVVPGIKAVVRVPEISGRTFPGTVTRIADALQPGTRTLLAEVDVPNRDGALAPGTYCIIELYIPRKTPTLFVPADAIIFNSDGLQVAVVEDGVARIRKVSVARDLGLELEVSDGLKPSDQVILNPAVDLEDGRKVQVRAAAAPKSS